MKIKICGITNRDDALAAADLGADALGFVFVPSSPRCMTPEHAAEVISVLPPAVTAVGVFRNAGREEIVRAIRLSGIGAIQLHGDEPPAETEGYAVPVWKAFGVDAAFRPAEMGRYRVAAFVLDTRSGGATGGTGVPFDWSIVPAAKPYGNIVLSGGITPENASRAVETADPWALDVGSGVECAPGRKDHERLRRLFAALR
jgi:phosphoribosylanthranilate isomerase